MQGYPPLAVAVPPPVTIRNGGAPIALTALKLAAGCFGVWLMIWRPDRLWIGALLAALALGFAMYAAMYELAHLTNRKVMVTLSGEGITDHRQLPPVTLPWPAIARVEQGGIGASVPPFLQLRRTDAFRESAEIADRHFQIDCAFLEHSPRSIAAQMLRFSPGLEADMGMLSPLRGGRARR